MFQVSHFTIIRGEKPFFSHGKFLHKYAPPPPPHPIFCMTYKNSRIKCLSNPRIFNCIIALNLLNLWCQYIPGSLMSEDYCSFTQCIRVFCKDLRNNGDLFLYTALTDWSLGAFENLQKTIIKLRHVCLSVRSHGTTRLPLEALW